MPPVPVVSPALVELLLDDVEFPVVEFALVELLAVEVDDTVLSPLEFAAPPVELDELSSLLEALVLLVVPAVPPSVSWTSESPALPQADNASRPVAAEPVAKRIRECKLIMPRDEASYVPYSVEPRSRDLRLTFGSLPPKSGTRCATHVVVLDRGGGESTPRSS